MDEVPGAAGEDVKAFRSVVKPPHPPEGGDVSWHFRPQDAALVSRLYNFRFKQALQHLAEDHPEAVRMTVEALASIFGDAGPMPRAQIRLVVQAAVYWVYGELEKLNRDSPANAPRLIRRPPFGDEGEW